MKTNKNNGIFLIKLTSMPHVNLLKTRLFILVDFFLNFCNMAKNNVYTNNTKFGVLFYRAFFCILIVNIVNMYFNGIVML